MDYNRWLLALGCLQKKIAVIYNVLIYVNTLLKKVSFEHFAYRAAGSNYFQHHPGATAAYARDGVTDYFACLFPVLHGSVIDSGLDAMFRVYPAEHSLENLALQLGYMSHSLDFDDYQAIFAVIPRPWCSPHCWR